MAFPSLPRRRHRTASTFFPYTTLFRSPRAARAGDLLGGRLADRRPGGAAARRAANRDRGVVHGGFAGGSARSEEHTSELQSLAYLVCRLLLEKKKNRSTESRILPPAEW